MDRADWVANQQKIVCIHLIHHQHTYIFLSCTNTIQFITQMESPESTLQVYICICVCLCLVVYL